MMATLGLLAVGVLALVFGLGGQRGVIERAASFRWLAMGLLLAVMMMVLAGFVSSPAVASAASLSWSAPIPLDTTGGTGTPLSALACPSASQCTALDESGQEVTFNPTAPGTPTPTTIDIGNTLFGLACPSASQCTAVESGGREVTFNPTAPGTPTPITIDTAGLNGPVACPSASQCTAVGGGDEVTFNPTAPGTPTPITIDPGGNGLIGVACPSASQCTAVDNGNGGRR